MVENFEDRRKSEVNPLIPMVSRLKCAVMLKRTGEKTNVVQIPVSRSQCSLFLHLFRVKVEQTFILKMEASLKARFGDEEVKFKFWILF